MSKAEQNHPAFIAYARELRAIHRPDNLPPWKKRWVKTRSDSRSCTAAKNVRSQNLCR